MNLTAFFASVVKLIEIFCQWNRASDFDETFTGLKHPVLYGVVNPHNLYWPNEHKEEAHDFIIVGGGSAGSVAAKRLSEHGKHKVLLLEIGGEPPPQTYVPAFLSQYFHNHDLAFVYKSVSQKHKGGFGGDIFPVGKVLGGSSIMNAMVFNRGHPEDFNQWANLTDDSSWNYTNVLKHFKEMEHYTGYHPSQEHGLYGPVQISSRADYTTGHSTDIWLNAGRELGIHPTGPNGPQAISFTPLEYNMKNGRRHTSFNGYIDHKKAVKGLKIITYANVTRILFDNEKRAIGVEYIKHGVLFIAKASKEVILTAGAFGTPKLLLQSGIGPADHLKELNVSVISDLPVGQNLMDHPIVCLSFVLKDPKKSFGEPEINMEEAIKEFDHNGTGPLTSAQGQVGQAFLASTIAAAEGYPNWPDYNLLVVHPRYPLILREPPQKNEDGSIQVKMTGVVSLGRPKSTGMVKLNTHHHYVHSHPIIDHNHFSDPGGHDKNVTIEAIKKLVSIFEETKVYKEFEPQFLKPKIPACDNNSTIYRSDEYWWCFIKENAHTGHHHSGTAKMGKIGDPTAVLDPHLKVNGVKGLRVLDASAMPTIPNSHIQAAVFLIAEKGSAQILADNYVPSTSTSSPFPVHYPPHNPFRSLTNH